MYFTYFVLMVLTNTRVPRFIKMSDDLYTGPPIKAIVANVLDIITNNPTQPTVAVPDVVVSPDTSESIVIDSLRDIPDDGFTLNNKRLLLTYRSHIDKIAIEKFLSTKGQELEFFRAAHETADKANPYPHTHVVAVFKKALQSKNSRVFDINGIHPNIKVIKTNVHYTNCLKYLAKEDPSNADLAGSVSTEQMNKDKINDIWECKTVSEAMLKHGSVKTAQQIVSIYNVKPPTPIDMPQYILMKWQLTIRNMVMSPWVQYVPPQEPEEEDRGILAPSVPLDKPMVWKTTSDGRDIYTIYNPEGCSGKTILIKWLNQHSNKRVHIAQGLPAMRDLAEVIKNAFIKGWTGETIMINLTRTTSEDNYYESLEALIDGLITGPKYSGSTHVWNPRFVMLFTNLMPKLTTLTKDRWKIYKIREDGWLEAMNYHDALKIYYNESADKLNDVAKTKHLALTKLYHTPVEYDDEGKPFIHAPSPTFSGITPTTKPPWERKPARARKTPAECKPVYNRIPPNVPANIHLYNQM
jgi:hypothetical protein